jgi:hypothetical protein
LIQFYGWYSLIVQQLGIVINIENTMANDTRNLREHLNLIAERFGTIPNLGQRRFEELRLAFHPTIDEILELNDILIGNISR